MTGPDAERLYTVRRADTAGAVLVIGRSFEDAAAGFLEHAEATAGEMDLIVMDEAGLERRFHVDVDPSH